jgi:hypothetical protein
VLLLCIFSKAFTVSTRGVTKTTFAPCKKQLLQKCGTFDTLTLTNLSWRLAWGGGSLRRHKGAVVDLFLECLETADKWRPYSVISLHGKGVIPASFNVKHPYHPAVYMYNQPQTLLAKGWVALSSVHRS